MVTLVVVDHRAVAPFAGCVKASGGIRDREAALKMIDAGATRLGTSSGIQICRPDATARTEENY